MASSKSPENTATKGDKESSPETTKRVRSARYAVYPSGLPNPLPGINQIRNDPDLLHSLGITWSEEEARDSQSSIPTVEYQPLANPYPPKSRWVAESLEAAEQLQHWFDNTRLSDARQKRLGITVLDQLQLQRVVTEDESVILTDENTGKPFGAVIRGYMGNDDVLQHMDSIMATQLEIGRNIRKDDRAIHQKKLDPSILAEAEASWEGLPRLGWNSLESSAEPVISVKTRNQDHELTNLPLGPPSGVCANLYEKYSHCERGDRDAWVFSLTTNFNGDADHGGTFYYADYGVMVRNARNTLTAHKSSKLHGTTVHEFNPRNPDLVHRGMSQTTSGRLRDAYQKFVAGQSVDTEPISGDEEE
ncbi:MAG: hypothetical protein Q9187_005210 [Circinaria calcarea]